MVTPVLKNDGTERNGTEQRNTRNILNKKYTKGRNLQNILKQNTEPSTFFSPVQIILIQCSVLN